MTAEPAPILAFDDIDSTNAEARRMAEAGQGGPIWVTALRQHAGRGRRGRAWSTTDGNLAATLLFTTDRPPAQAAQVSFVAALAVHDMAASFAPGADLALKWPNDPMLNGVKLGGILVESGPWPTGGLWVAVGCGVNLAHAPDNTERPAAALASVLALPPAPDEAARRLAGRMASWMALWDTAGFAPIAAAWTQRALGLGGPCTARLTHESVEGVAEGLESDGALRLRLADGSIRRITAGDVFF